MIARKIQEAKYNSLNEMEKDLLQMTKNACAFNEPGSQIYKDAKALRKTIQSKKIEVEHSKNSSGKSSERIRLVIKVFQESAFPKFLCLQLASNFFYEYPKKI